LKDLDSQQWLSFFITKGKGDYPMNKQFKNLVNKYQRLLIVAGIAVIIIAIAIAHNRATNLNSQQTADTQPTTSNQSSSSTPDDSSPSTPTVTPTTTPKPTAPTTAQQVTSWYSQYGSSITNLTNDFTQMSQEGTDSSAIEATCTQIFDDATKAEGEPVIPDTSVENDWSSALNSYVTAAQECQDGVANEDATEINQATTDFDTGNTSLDSAAAAIQKLMD
jgi:cytoskeletal protein RodZ